MLTHGAGGDFGGDYPAALGCLSAWAEEDPNTPQHMLLTLTPLLWLSKLYTPPPAPLPTLPCECFHQPPEALAAWKHRVSLTNLFAKLRPTWADHKDEHPSLSPPIPASSVSPSPSLIFFHPQLSCPPLLRLTVQVKVNAEKWNAGQGHPWHPWQRIGLHYYTRKSFGYILFWRCTFLPVLYSVDLALCYCRVEKKK